MSNKDHTLEEKLSLLVEAYDLNGLIAFSQQVPESDVERWRTEVMESGFMALYSYFSYDQMCDKLGEGGLDLLDEVIESAEVFHGSRLRKLRAEVLNYRLDEVSDTAIDQSKAFALRAIDELSSETLTDHSVLKFRASLYHQLAQLDIRQALPYWQLAIGDLKDANDFNLSILYHVWKPSIDGMPEVQRQACIEFNDRINPELKMNPDLIWDLLDEGVRLLESNQNTELEKQVFIWLQSALGWKSDDAKLLRKAGLLMHKQGKLYQRADYFAKAIECFELFIMNDDAHAMEVFYMAGVWEDWALLHQKEGHSETNRLMKAWEVYRKDEHVVRMNFSPLLHYAEFLERLYYNDRLTERPAEEKIIALAVEAEVMGNGYYSGPGMILARMAISNDDAETAIYHLCRLLLRHELCIDNLIKSLRQSLTDKISQEVMNFLDDTLIFMDDVSEGYFYNPAFTMEELNKMSRIETPNAWQMRMMEIRNRKR